MIALTPVANSTQIEASGYDDASQTLALRFKRSRATYNYQGVPPDVAAAFNVAESPGKFFGATVRGQYEHTKVVDED